ncbi:hypothetical protein BP5796_07081 [Coleophoma crateriformis]|uniref:Uncharacterized protein n=1 Tax=Coleophoma crateriformis TaxID=565419 RepID=A0A3D8RHV3_9HELO|nr:hypothetical protein BP5796_07081 [Coleophoma crateriformis]
MKERIKEEIRAYADSLRRETHTDAKLEQWVETNIPRYMVGRSDSANAKFELGQWYIMCRNISFDGRVQCSHPFFDSATEPDIVAAEIIYICDRIVTTRVNKNGMPPHNPLQQQAWYREALRDSLTIAGQTRFRQVIPEPVSSSLQLPSPYQPDDLNGPSSVCDPLSTMGPLDLSTFSNAQTALSTMPSSYLPTHHQQSGMIGVSGLQMPMSHVSSEMVQDQTGGPHWDNYQQNIETGQAFGARYNLYEDQFDSTEYEHIPPQIPGNSSQYPQGWSGQSAQQGHQ